MKTTTIVRPKSKTIATTNRYRIYRIQEMSDGEWLTMGSDLYTLDDAIRQSELWSARMPYTKFRFKEIITVVTETVVENE